MKKTMAAVCFLIAIIGFLVGILTEKSFFTESMLILILGHILNSKTN